MGVKHGDLAMGLPARFHDDPTGVPQTPEQLESWLAELEAGLIPIPPMCDRHADQLERETGRAVGAVLAPYMVTSTLLFQVAAADPELWKPADGIPEPTIQDVGRRLTRAGCHACRYPRAFMAAARIIRRRGLHFAAGLSKNEERSANWRPDVFAVDRR